MSQTGTVAAAIFGANPNSWFMYWALRRRGIQTFVFAEDVSKGFGNIQIIRCPPADDGVAFLSWLDSFASSNPALKLVVLPSSDQYAQFFAAAKNRLPQSCVLRCPSPEAVETCVDKVRFRDFCERNKLHAPATFSFASRDEFERGSAAIPYPVIVKRPRALSESIMAKVTLAVDREQLLEIASNVWGHGISLLLQEYIPGSYEDIVFIGGYVDEQNGARDIFVGTKELEYPLLGGTTTACRLAWQEDAVESAMHVLRLLNYEGMFDIEYKRDTRSGLLTIIEVNPRIGFWHRVSEDGGMDVISCYVLTASGAQLRSQLNYQAHADGRVWVAGHLHLLACIERFGLLRGLRRWLRDMRRPGRIRDRYRPGWRTLAAHARRVLGRFRELGLFAVLRGAGNA